MSKRLTDEERQRAQEWCDGKWLGDGWMALMPKLLAESAQLRQEVARLREALGMIAATFCAADLPVPDMRHTEAFCPSCVARRALAAPPREGGET